MKFNPAVESIGVVARPDQTFTVAVIVPDPVNLTKFAQEVVGKKGFTAAQLCKDAAVKKALCDNLFKFGLSNGLEKFEIPKKISLVLDEWTPESGIVTALMKLKRKEFEKHYSREIEDMYNIKKNTVVQWVDEKKNKA